jgi:pyruvate dehydrogenase E2 component (dihydrolipoamide acetyltransferase)
MRYLDSKAGSGPAQNKSRIAPSSDKQGQQDDEPEATDAAERLAKEAGIDIATVKGSGEGGRVLARDVQAAIDAGKQ